jgi:hypothetical protein
MMRGDWTLTICRKNCFEMLWCPWVCGRLVSFVLGLDQWVLIFVLGGSFFLIGKQK